MDSESNMRNHLEQMLLDASAEPTYLPLSLLKAITNNFSDHQKIGRGGFAVVYKGLLHNGTVAVKKMSKLDIDEKDFNQEVSSMKGVKHKNIVRFLGYCADTQGKVEKYQGNVVMLEERHRLLCFEFLPNGGLDKYISDASSGLDWRTRYQIIKGICEGLDYLHEQKIVHLDLKPENILLDHCMVPKIADFGISKHFAENQTRATTSNPRGTLGYMAPESFAGKFTFKSDIYSLGTIIIEMLTGCKGYPEIKNVLENWRIRLGTSQGDTWLEHVRLCIVIGRECVDSDPEKRPTIRHIIERLDEMDHTYGFIESELGASSTTHIRRPLGSLVISKPLDIHPVELNFPFVPDKRIECTVTLTNRTNRHVGFRITPTECIFADLWGPSVGPSFQTMGPHSTLATHIAMEKQPQRPQKAGKLEVLMVVMRSHERLGKLLTSVEKNVDKDGDDILKRIESLGGQVHRELLTAVIYDDPASSQLQAVIHNDQKFIPTSEFGRVRCIDVHPTETWVLAGHDCGRASIWNYQTQEKVMVLYVSQEDGEDGCGISSAIQFIAREKWFAAGDYGGWVHVFAYTTRDKFKKFQAHDDGCPITALALHPTEPFLLTSSSADYALIKLWDWGQGWICTREFDGHSSGVNNLTLNTRETDTFASVSRSDGKAEFKVWDIHRSDPKITMLEERSESAACSFYTNSHRHLVLTSGQQGRHSYAMIRDSQTGELVHQLALSSWRVLDLSCHPMLPILATMVTDFYDESYQICLWDARTYRLEKIVQLTKRPIKAMVLTGTKELARLFVTIREGISIMEINLPTLKMDLSTGGGTN